MTMIDKLREMQFHQRQWIDLQSSAGPARPTRARRPLPITEGSRSVLGRQAKRKQKWLRLIWMCCARWTHVQQVRGWNQSHGVAALTLIDRPAGRRPSCATPIQPAVAVVAQRHGPDLAA